MSVAFEFCLPTRGQKVPAGPDWIHEVKYDGYRMRLERDGERVRLFIRKRTDASHAGMSKSTAQYRRIP